MYGQDINNSLFDILYGLILTSVSVSVRILIILRMEDRITSSGDDKDADPFPD